MSSVNNFESTIIIIRDVANICMPTDYYIPNIFVVNKGDSVTMHFYNFDADERNTFTIGAPYNINEDVAPQHNATFMFKTGNEGVYSFYCTYHQPTMTGQLIVLPPSTVLTATIGGSELRGILGSQNFDSSRCWLREIISMYIKLFSRFIEFVF